MENGILCFSSYFSSSCNTSSLVTVLGTVGPLAMMSSGSPMTSERTSVITCKIKVIIITVKKLTKLLVLQHDDMVTPLLEKQLLPVSLL